uniref:Dynactin subunit 2-like isoform X1 n=1 Tax=Petromyzon marinus TaxID=7757 RepID=A0AAJ7UA61_PETMA|nr:dynactin subunit 2-like isoform X1 [Petromyzon marinus]XP_032831496.1 dynactin subunit 2-like isoform X1 [Petromyzon marinus]XP_032831497.1 dynactin subunit 2-like isoform X1 [Petromyzon marinus]
MMGIFPDGNLQKLNALLANLQRSNILGAVEVLQCRIGLLQTSTLDHVEFQLQGLLVKMSELDTFRSALDEPSVTGESAVRETCQVEALRAVLERLEWVVQAVPGIVHRLVVQASEHDHALRFGQQLHGMEAAQQSRAGTLRDNVALLLEMEQSLKENVASVQTNFASLEARVTQLGQ